jgi:very-short-patch-repair endonuclease
MSLIRRSKHEELLQKSLKLRKVLFETEKTFENCISNKNKRLLFDIFINETNILIELDGEQHFKSRRDECPDKILNRILNDQLKNKFCIKNKIRLIRIPYSLDLKTVSKVFKEISMSKGDLCSTTIERYNLFDSYNNSSMSNYYNSIEPTYGIMFSRVVDKLRVNET